jgi:hypothetical protein
MGNLRGFPTSEGLVVDRPERRSRLNFRRAQGFVFSLDFNVFIDIPLSCFIKINR